jgi:hypothetical protein
VFFTLPSLFRVRNLTIYERDLSFSFQNFFGLRARMRFFFEASEAASGELSSRENQ